MPLYAVSQGSEENDEILLWHDKTLKKGEWHAMVEDALRKGNLSRESVADYLCREHGFAVTEPRFGVHLDGAVTCGGDVMIPTKESYSRSSATYVGVWSEFSEWLSPFWKRAKCRLVVATTPLGSFARQLRDLSKG